MVTLVVKGELNDLCTGSSLATKLLYDLKRMSEEHTHNSYRVQHNNPDLSIWQEVAAVNLIHSAFLSRKVQWCQFDVTDQQVQSTHKMKS
jgi:hypothetical protein